MKSNIIKLTPLHVSAPIVDKSILLEIAKDIRISDTFSNLLSQVNINRNEECLDNKSSNINDRFHNLPISIIKEYDAIVMQLGALTTSIRNLTHKIADLRNECGYDDSNKVHTVLFSSITKKVKDLLEVAKSNENENKKHKIGCGCATFDSNNTLHSHSNSNSNRHPTNIYSVSPNHFILGDNSTTDETNKLAYCDVHSFRERSTPVKREFKENKSTPFSIPKICSKPLYSDSSPKILVPFFPLKPVNYFSIIHVLSKHKFIDKHQSSNLKHEVVNKNSKVTDALREYEETGDFNIFFTLMENLMNGSPNNSI